MDMIYMAFIALKTRFVISFTCHLPGKLVCNGTVIDGAQVNTSDVQFLNSLQDCSVNEVLIIVANPITYFNSDRALLLK
jgi:hypothetical protein